MNRHVQIWSKPRTKPPSAAAPNSAKPPTAPTRRAESRENVNRAPQETQWNTLEPKGTRHLEQREPRSGEAACSAPRSRGPRSPQ